MSVSVSVSARPADPAGAAPGDLRAHSLEPTSDAASAPGRAPSRSDLRETGTASPAPDPGSLATAQTEANDVAGVSAAPTVADTGSAASRPAGDTSAVASGQQVAAAAQAFAGNGSASQGGSPRRGGAAAAAAGAAEVVSAPAPGSTPVTGPPAPVAAGSTEGTAPTGGGPQTPATPQAMATQVARHITGLRTLNDGTHRTVVHLSPEHLGDLTLTVDVRAGSVQLAMAGEQAAIATLRDGLSQLRDQLADAGLDLGAVSLRDNASDPGKDQRQAPAAADDNSGRNSAPGRRGADQQEGRRPGGSRFSGDLPAPTGTGPAAPGATRIDVRV